MESQAKLIKKLVELVDVLLGIIVRARIIPQESPELKEIEKEFQLMKKNLGL